MNRNHFVRLALVIAALALCSTTMAATYTEDFNASSTAGGNTANAWGDASGTWAVISNPEVIRRMATIAAVPMSSWAWGGYSAVGGGGNHGVTSDGIVWINHGAIAVGSYVYTRFDTASALGGTNMANVPSVTIDASAAGSTVAVTTGTPPGTWGYPTTTHPALALLIRTNAGWFQSNAHATLAAPATTLTFTLSSLTWNALSGTADMDEVDNGGETAITLGASGTPVLSAITGLGFIVTSPGSSTAGAAELWLDQVVIATGGAPASVKSWVSW